jgi:hypothetical protein
MARSALTRALALAMLLALALVFAPRWAPTQPVRLTLSAPVQELDAGLWWLVGVVARCCALAVLYLLFFNTCMVGAVEGPDGGEEAGLARRGRGAGKQRAYEEEEVEEASVAGRSRVTGKQRAYEEEEEEEEVQVTLARRSKVTGKQRSSSARR